jgi:hypothetical protein
MSSTLISAICPGVTKGTGELFPKDCVLGPEPSDLPPCSVEALLGRLWSWSLGNCPSQGPSSPPRDGRRPLSELQRNPLWRPID